MWILHFKDNVSICEYDDLKYENRMLTEIWKTGSWIKLLLNDRAVI